MRSGPVLVALGCAAALGCSSSADRAAPLSQSASAEAKSATPALPCAVDTILREKCQQCHGHPTQQTAPMSLTTWQELHAAARGADAAQSKVFERVRERLHDRLRPMPPRDRPQLSAQELSTLDIWLDADAPVGEACPARGDAGDGTDDARGRAMSDAEADAGSDDAVGLDSHASTAGAGARAGTGPTSSQPAQTTGADASSSPTDAAVDDAEHVEDTPGEDESTQDAPHRPDAQECDYVEIRAQQDPTGTPYTVPADATDHYQCFLIDLAFDAPTQALSFEHAPDNEAVVHHWMLRTIEYVNREPTLITCDDLYPTNKLVAGWAPGASDWYLPKDVGVDLGRGLFILEMHYNNIGNPAALDSSGVRICTTKQLRPNTASVSWLGNQSFVIPAREPNYEVSGRCLPTHQTEPIHILQVWPHMHMRGLRSSMRIDRVDGSSEALFDEPFAFGSQKAYRTPAIVRPGDSVVSSCFFDNPSSFPVSVGTGTAQEMCHFFVVSYPAYQLVNDAFSIENDVCLGAL